MFNGASIFSFHSFAAETLSLFSSQKICFHVRTYLCLKEIACQNYLQSFLFSQPLKFLWLYFVIQFLKWTDIFFFCVTYLNQVNTALAITQQSPRNNHFLFEHTLDLPSEFCSFLFKIVSFSFKIIANVEVAASHYFASSICFLIALTASIIIFLFVENYFLCLFYST